MTTPPDATWAAKVAKLEATQEACARDIVNLVAVVHGLSTTVTNLAQNTSAQIERLAVGLAAATGPRKTDWAVLVAAGVLVLAIGNGALSPITQRVSDLQDNQVRLRQQLEDHKMLPLHPVGQARIDILDRDVNEKLMALTKELDNVREHGSPMTAARLAVVEERLRKLDR